jgi:hypothetical protein
MGNGEPTLKLWDVQLKYLDNISTPRVFFSFLFPIVWSSHIGDHPQEDLAKFGYRSEKKVEKLRTLLYSNNIQPIVQIIAIS